MDYEIKELGVGGILDQTVRLIKNNFGMVALLSLVGCGTVIAMVLISFFGLGLAEVFGGNTSSLVYNPLMILGLLVMVLFLMVFFIGFVASIIAYFAKAYIGEKMGLFQTLKEGFRRTLPLGWTSFLKLLVFAAFGAMYAILLSIIASVAPSLDIVFFFGGIPVFLFLAYLFFRWGLTDQIVVVEGISGPKALRRSTFLMKKNIWKAIGISFLLALCMILIKIPFLFVPNVILGIVFDILCQGLSYFVAIVATTVLYFSSRCQKEGFDLKMLADSISSSQADVLNSATPAE